jgi:hypothetical protein
MPPIKPEDPELTCPHCDEKRYGWTPIRTHMMTRHGETSEGGAAMTSMPRMKELLKRHAKFRNAPPPPKASE